MPVKAGVIIRAGSLWVGMHWSDLNKRICFNPLPCVTFWMTFKGGTIPYGVQV